MEYSVAEAAGRLGLSQQRVRQLLVSRQLRGRRVGHRWIVEEIGLSRSGLRSRPMSSRMAWALAYLADGNPVHNVNAKERARISSHVDRLRQDPDRVFLLRGWMASRAERVELSVAADDVSDLRSDDRVIPSGLSDSRVEISAGGQVEGYVHRLDLPALAQDFLLVRAEPPNVVLHVVDDDRLPRRPLPALIVAADLSDWGGAREIQRADSLLLQALS